MSSDLTISRDWSVPVSLAAGSSEDCLAQPSGSTTQGHTPRSAPTLTPARRRPSAVPDSHVIPRRRSVSRSPRPASNMGTPVPTRPSVARASVWTGGVRTLVPTNPSAVVPSVPAATECPHARKVFVPMCVPVMTATAVRAAGASRKVVIAPLSTAPATGIAPRDQPAVTTAGALTLTSAAATLRAAHPGTSAWAR
jgi:hypothetical protein